MCRPGLKIFDTFHFERTLWSLKCFIAEISYWPGLLCHSVEGGEFAFILCWSLVISFFIWHGNLFCRMCRGCNYFLSRSTHFAVRCHCIGGAGNHHFACVFSNVVKQMKEKAIRQVCMNDWGGGDNISKGWGLFIICKPRY